MRHKGNQCFLIYVIPPKYENISDLTFFVLSWSDPWKSFNSHAMDSLLTWVIRSFKGSFGILLKAFAVKRISSPAPAAARLGVQ